MPAKQTTTPTARLRRLAAALRQLREGAGMTREEVTARTRINSVTLYRIETARARPQQRTLLALLDLYGADAAKSAELADMAKPATDQGWMRLYRSDLPDEYRTYIDFEAEASSIQNYETSFIPGLLQTEQYAHHVIRGGMLPMTDADIEKHVTVRMARQQVLQREGQQLQLWAIIDEASLRRSVGGHDVMRDQMRHLLAATSVPHVTLQVIPFDSGAHPGMLGSFALLDFTDSMDAPVVYIDSMAGDLFLDADADIKRYSKVFDNLRAIALSPDASTALIDRRANEFE